MSEHSLKITAPAGAVCGLYPGTPASTNYFAIIDPEKAILPSQVDEGGQATVYIYTQLRPGIYHIGVSKEGYNALCQVVDMAQEKDLALDVALVPLAVGGYSAGYVTRCTQALIDAQFPSASDAWGPEYAELFTTPQFQRTTQLHQQTTQEEMAAYIAQLSKTCAHMHVFSLGTSPKYGFDMPLVLFTREDVAGRSLEEAARIIGENGKPTIQYIAQCHGTEPVSCEGALAMMTKLCGDYGQRALDGVDIYIIPRVNPDGAHDVLRCSPTTKEDMNRDYMRANNREIQLVIGAYNLFAPEIAIDGHEKLNDVKKDGNSLCTDMELQVGAGSLNHPAAMTELAMKMARLALGKAQKLGLRSHFYARLASAAGGSAGSSYFGNRNSLSFLVETPGQASAGGEFMHRRVLGQYVLASTVIDYALEHAQEIMATVHGSRQEMLKTGPVYDENNKIILQHANVQTGTWTTPLIHVPTGAVIDPTHSEGYNEQVQFTLSRSRATAYILPLGLEHEAQILKIAGIHGIGHYLLPAGCKVMLRQYLELEGSTSLTEEKSVCFPEGAYVFPNTVPSTILGMLMEPDYNRTPVRKITLLSMGLMEPDARGRLPLYRYCHDLTDSKVAVER